MGTEKSSVKSRPYNYDIYRRWYLKMKAAKDGRYQALLEKGRQRLADYRHSGSAKYKRLLERRCLRNSLNPFPKRERGLAYYREIKSDPVAYKGMLEKRRAYYAERMAKLRANPEAYKRYLNDRMVYHRFHRIVKGAAAQ